MAYDRLKAGRVRFSVVIAVLLFATIPNLTNTLIFPVSAGETNNFGNSGNPQSVSISFAAAGYDTSTNLTLGANAVVNSASLDVRGWQDQQGISPLTISVDVGDDGDIEWGFGGIGNGSFGHVNELSNGWNRVGVNLSSGYNSAYSIRLPLNATISSATLNVSTLSVMTLSGNDVQDSYIHNPNPIWGTMAYKDYNHGNHSVTRVGKTEWSNWNIYRSVYWFNLSQLPGATVLDANLSFWVDDVVNNANTGQPVTAQHTYNVHPLLKDWIEGLEINSMVSQGPGVTWNNAIDNVTGVDYAWTTAGASSASDRDASVASITDSPANLEQNWLTFNSQSFTDLIQSWANGSVANQGIILIGDENTSKPDGSALVITSRANASYGPRLEIVFEGSDNITAGLDVGNDSTWEWNHAGILTNGSSMLNIASALNQLLATSTPTFTDEWGNQFVDIPLNISGNSTLVLSDIDVRYDWNPTVSISAHGDLTSEINQHLTNLTPDVTGNVSIVINVTSGSAGIVELSQLSINFGDRPPSIGQFILPTDTFVPNGETFQVGLQVTSYQGLTNLSWVALTPQLQNMATRPVLVYSLVNGSSWVSDPGGFVSSFSGQWQQLNADTGTMLWDLEVSWAWAQQQDVVWHAQTGTVDSLHSDRYSSQTTDHERRLEITSFHLWDETAPSDGGTEVFEDEWVRGGDQLRVSGVVRFLDQASFPRVGDIEVELENVSGNDTVDANGAFSIDTYAPMANQYAGFTITANIAGPLDATTPGTNARTFRIDATLPGLMLQSPTGERVQPNSQQVVNVSVADTISLDENSLRLYWWVESMHDDGDGIPEEGEYADSPLLRQGNSEYYHAIFDDTANSNDQLVSVYVAGSDHVGNLLGGGPGLEADLTHYVSLVPNPTTLENSSLELPGGDVIVPGHLGWLNLTLNDENHLEDIERLVIDFGQGTKLTWQKDGGFQSNDPEIQVDSFTFTSVGIADELWMNISFGVTSLFDPDVTSGMIAIMATDSSGVHLLDTGIFWQYNADIMLTEYSVSFADDPLQTALEYDDYAALGARLLISGRVRYTAVDLAPPAYSLQITVQVPLDSPLQVQTDASGQYSATMDALGSGLYQVSIQVVLGPGIVSSAPMPLRLQIDDQPPTLVGSAPGFISANSTSLTLQFDLQELGAGMSQEQVAISCLMRNGFDTVGEQIEGIANRQVSGQVSRFLVNLTFPPLLGVDALVCWMQVSDDVGNPISGPGSSPTWPLSLPVIEVRPDLIASAISLNPEAPTFGQTTQVEITIVNLGNHTAKPFLVTIEAHGVEADREMVAFLEGQMTTTITLEWVPDWEGELDLMVYVDADEQVVERNENNSFSWPVNVEPEPRGSFSAFSWATGLGLLILLAVGVLAFIIWNRNQSDDEYEEWEEEYESEDESKDESSEDDD